jgi:uncharacterized protein (DUF924 family)
MDQKSEAVDRSRAEAERGVREPAMNTPAASPRQVLDFWFGLERPGEKDDPAVRAVLGETYEQAARHRLDSWAERPRERLALILLLDQAPRHLYREDARAFATDLKAQALTGRFFERGDWMDFRSLERFHSALPFLHSEVVGRQQQVNPVIHACARELPGLHFMGRMADMYLATIRRFGYFPHRNALRGVPNSPEEQSFLDEDWGPHRRRLAAAPAPEGQ